MRKLVHPGAHPGPKDHRDWLHKNITKARVEDIPVEGGLDDVPLIIHDQGDMPICTGEIGAYVQMVNQYFETGDMIDLSPMFVYKMNKEIDGLAPDVEGSTVKATVKTLKLKGVCREVLYPSSEASYDKSFPSNPRLKGRIMRNAYQHRIISYAKCTNLDDILVALSEKKPVVFSMYLLSNFYKARKGMVPQQVGGSNVGGHAMVALRYNKEEEWVKVVNSWGIGSPTDKGYMYIPFSWFDYNVRENFPALMEAYTVLDYIPEGAKATPDALAIDNNPINILVNNEKVKDLNIPPLFMNEFGKPLVHTDMLAKIFEAISGHKVKIDWDGGEFTLKINI